LTDFGGATEIPHRAAEEHPRLRGAVALVADTGVRSADG
jgi:hypothetical protein